MNQQQNKTLNYLLAATNMTAQKSDLVSGATGGRSESRADLTELEADALIKYLEGLPRTITKEAAAAEKMRRKVIATCREMGFYKVSAKPGVKFEADMERINAWCEKYGYGKKPLNDYTYDELPKLVTQIETVLDKYLKKI